MALRALVIGLDGLEPTLAERLMAAVGLPMEAEQLRFHERGEASPTPSYAQVQQPLNDRSIGRWCNYAAELEPVRSVVAAAMARGGYAD